ncbi:ATP-binding protein [uncultured Gemmiger sp.]|uniref:ATP-binding protein n=1 Tax=uncultured Gemmiger sp. TaxID=1623490 RepID=UPI0025DCD005|nr:sensor histidine kinase [uncultured Gemmiger sp.]
MAAKIFTLGVMQCSLLVAALFMIPLPKKRGFPIRLAIGVTAGLLLAVPISLYHKWVSAAARQLAVGTEAAIVAGSLLELVLYWACITALFALCCEGNLRYKAYCAACAYTTQDFAYTIFVILFPEGAHRGARPGIPGTLCMELLLMAVCYAIFYRIIALKILTMREEIERSRGALLYGAAVALMGRAMGTLASVHYSPEAQEMFRIITIYDAVLSLSLLSAQVLIFRQITYKQQIAMENRLRNQEYQQFTMYQDSVETLRHKCHDLKHILFALQQEDTTGRGESILKDLQTAVGNYDATFNTGNPTLDALLNKTWNSCEQRGIQWTCMADGTALRFVDPFDLYIMLGNAFDNALECVSALKEPDKKFMSVNIRRKGSLALVCLRNYCDHALTFSDGLPMTTKAEKSEHGYGMKSIREIAEKYNGTVSAKIEGDIFTLTIMIPMAE